MTHHEIKVSIVVDTGAQTGVVVHELFFCHLKHINMSLCKGIVMVLWKVMSTHALVADSSNGSNSAGRSICRQSLSSAVN
jgi:hypothetical protein